MALDNNNGKRKPHTRQEEFEEQKRALEDRIVNDSTMADKIYQRAMEAEAHTEEPHAADRSPSIKRADRSSGTAGMPGRPPERRRAQASVGSETQKNAEKTVTGQPENSRKESEGKEAAKPGETQNSTERRAFHAYTLEEEEAGRRSVRQMNSVKESEAEVQKRRQDQKASKKHKRRNLIIACIVEVITLVLIFGFGAVLRYMNMTQQIEFNIENVQNDNIDIAKKQTMEGYWTVAVFGVDSRDSSVGKGANADVQLIVNVDMGTGEVKLVSVYRDTYLNVNSGNSYAKVNQAYAEGGPEQAVQTLNKNLDLNIQNYVTFNWTAAAQAIELLGGVEVDIPQKEVAYMNAYIHEICIETGVSAKNPAAYYIDGAGKQHLNGIQTVAYARLRKLDTDFARTERQREVIQQCLENAKKADLATLLQIVDTVLPQIAFNINTADIIQLAKGISRYNIVETVGFPMKLSTQVMGKKGDCVIPVTLESNVSELHSVLYGDEDYDPSDAVKRYSQKIADDAAKYKSGYYDSTTAAKQEETTEAETTEEESRSQSSTRVDSDGYLIKGTDEDGHYIYETDEDGNKIKPKETTKAESSSSGKNETSRPGLTEENESESGSHGPGVETEESSRHPGESTTAANKPTVNPTAESTTEAGPVLPGESTTAAKPDKPSVITPTESTTAAPTPTTGAVPGGTAGPAGGSDPVPVFPGA